MRLKNLTKTGQKLGDIYTRKLKKGEKDPFRVSLQKYSPQTAAQDLDVLRDEIRELSKSQESKDANGNMRTTMPILTLSEKDCINLYKKLFKKFYDSQLKLTFNGKRKGTDGVRLTPELHRELEQYAKTKVGKGNWLIAPCKNLNVFDKSVKKKYADELLSLIHI